MNQIHLAVAGCSCAVRDVVVKMSFASTINSKAASREHVLAVTRDFNSQPRLSKFYFDCYISKMQEFCWVGRRLMDGEETGHVIIRVSFKINDNSLTSPHPKKLSFNLCCI